MAKGNASLKTGVQALMQFKDVTRPHYWYVVLSNCGSKIDIEYDFTFINGGGPWDRQFSYDEQGI